MTTLIKYLIDILFNLVMKIETPLMNFNLNSLAYLSFLGIVLFIIRSTPKNVRWVVSLISLSRQKNVSNTKLSLEKESNLVPN